MACPGADLKLFRFDKRAGRPFWTPAQPAPRRGERHGGREPILSGTLTARRERAFQYGLSGGRFEALQIRQKGRKALLDAGVSRCPAGVSAMEGAGYRAGSGCWVAPMGRSYGAWDQVIVGAARGRGRWSCPACKFQYVVDGNPFRTVCLLPLLPRREHPVLLCCLPVPIPPG